MSEAEGRWGEVWETTGGVYRVELGGGEQVDAFLRGRLKREARAGDRVVVGDRVRVVSEPGADESTWTIEEVEPRRSQIVRRSGPGRKAKAVAANVDRLVVVASVVAPDPRPEVIDRLLVLAESDEVPAVLVLNKVDLPGGEASAKALSAIYRPIGYDVRTVSAETGEGLPPLAALLSEGVSAFVGPSGVGKSSLLNAIHPGLSLRTGDVSRRLQRGRHTTVSSRLIPLPGGGLVADTPGFADVGVWGVGESEVERCYPEIARWAEQCRFRGCAHAGEPGCAVIEAIEAGEIAPSRLESFRLLRDEARADARHGGRRNG
ncbi:ribosome small subunit-dependent GTPase A [Gaopeijia maritima]|uniref:Small ribosomal subunit biogenesis GTPase RsgA n=1 Tax=Gaopeijia maritima TaxID=3119007 RepID=A0ABU9E8K5_9BACT